MKKTTQLLLIVFAAWLMQGCGNSPKDSTAKADSINKTNDSSDKVHPGVPATEVSGDDATFAVAAANGGMAEVELGKLAEQKGASMLVRDFGGMMVKDHSKANDELKNIAESKHVVLPDSLNDDEKKIKADLLSKSGADFDKAYVNAMLEDHKKDIKEFERAAKVVKYPDMLEFVKRTLPVLRHHLEEIEKIKGQMK